MAVDQDPTTHTRWGPTYITDHRFEFEIPGDGSVIISVFSGDHLIARTRGDLGRLGGCPPAPWSEKQFAYPPRVRGLLAALANRIVQAGHWLGKQADRVLVVRKIKVTANIRDEPFDNFEELSAYVSGHTRHPV